MPHQANQRAIDSYQGARAENRRTSKSCRVALRKLYSYSGKIWSYIKRIRKSKEGKWLEINKRKRTCWNQSILMVRKYIIIIKDQVKR